MVLHFNPPIALSELDLSLNLWNFDFGKMGKKTAGVVESVTLCSLVRGWERKEEVEHEEGCRKVLLYLSL